MVPSAPCPSARTHPTVVGVTDSPSTVSKICTSIVPGTPAFPGEPTRPRTTNSAGAVIPESRNGPGLRVVPIGLLRESLRGPRPFGCIDAKSRDERKRETVPNAHRTDCRTRESGRRPRHWGRFVVADFSGFSMRLKTRPIARPSSDCRNRPAISNLRMCCIRRLAADSPGSLSLTTGLLPGLSGTRGPVRPLRPGYHTCFIHGDIRNRTETVSRLDRHLTY